MSELVVKGKFFFRGNFENCCISIDNGKITHIKKILYGNKTLDFQNKLILPAGVDIHVHFREPGLTNKEDWSTGSIAAAFGGISCVFDMPNTIPQSFQPFPELPLPQMQRRVPVPAGRRQAGNGPGPAGNLPPPDRTPD